MNFCNCCCFKGGCCTEPCCEKGCCGCPNYEKPLLDVRILNTLEEAFNMKAGLYVVLCILRWIVVDVIIKKLDIKNVEKDLLWIMLVVLVEECN